MANAMLQEEFKSSHLDLESLNHNNNVMVNINHNNNNVNNSGSPTMTPMEGPPKLVSTAPPPMPSSGEKQSPRKSVEFALQPLAPPPSKRARPNVPWTAKQVVDAISTSITRNERLEAIQNAKDSFNHDVQAVHDDEMKTGADATLAKHLTFLAFHAQACGQSGMNEGADGAAAAQQLEGLLTEISLTTDVLESLYRASSATVGASFQRMGRDLMQLIVGVLNNELQRRATRQEHRAKRQQQQQQTNDDELVQQPMSTTPELAEPDNSNNNNNDDPLGNNNNEAATEQQQQQPTDGAADNEEDQKPAATPDPFLKDDSLDGSLNSATGGADPLTTTTTRAESPVPIGTPEGDLFLRKATKILGHFARVGEATKPMAHYPGLLGSLLSLIGVQPYNAVPWEARLSALWILANLACNSENMQMMAIMPGMIGCLVEVSCRPLHPGDSLEKTMEILRSRAIASRAILNLSWSPENKIILAEHAPLVDLLAELTVHRKGPLAKSRTVHDILITTRRHAVGALRNLAAAPRRIKIGLCEYRRGHLLDTLTDAALNDPDTGVKDRAFAAIHNLAIHDTAEKIVNHPALVLALKDVLLSEERPEDHEEGSSPKSHASATLLVLERTITPHMDSYENLRDLLDAVNPNPTTTTPTDTESEMEVLHPTAV